MRRLLPVCSGVVASAMLFRRPTTATPIALACMRCESTNTPKDWRCHCGVTNYGFRSVCFDCSSPRADLEGSDGKQQRPGVGKPFRRGDWNCAKCGNHNYASRSSCISCHSPRQLNPWTCNSCRQTNTAEAAFCTGCGLSREDVVTGRCKHCGSTGQSGQFCSNCGGKALGGGGKRGGEGRGDWTCACGFVNFHFRDKCVECEKANPAGAPSDWMCSCGFLNYKMRSKCKECGGSKTSVIAAEVPSSRRERRPDQYRSNYRQRGSGDVVPRGSSPPAGRRQPRQGDWKCKCGFINYKGRELCMQCGAQMENHMIVHMPLREGDWMCPTCKNHNFQRREACRHCGNRKPVDVGGAGQEKDGADGAAAVASWRCTNCGATNGPKRPTCTDCGATRKILSNIKKAEEVAAGEGKEEKKDPEEGNKALSEEEGKKVEESEASVVEEKEPPKAI